VCVHLLRGFFVNSVCVLKLWQMNTEVYQDQINAKYGTKFKMPIVYYSQLLSIAYGNSAKDAALDGQVIRAEKREKIAGK